MMLPPVGTEMSLLKVSADVPVLVATSCPVTVRVEGLVGVVVQLNRLEVNGPPTGVLSV